MSLYLDEFKRIEIHLIQIIIGSLDSTLVFKSIFYSKLFILHLASPCIVCYSVHDSGLVQARLNRTIRSHTKYIYILCRYTYIYSRFTARPKSLVRRFIITQIYNMLFYTIAYIIISGYNISAGTHEHNNTVRKRIENKSLVQ